MRAYTIPPIMKGHIVRKVMPNVANPTLSQYAATVSPVQLALKTQRRKQTVSPTSPVLRNAPPTPPSLK